MEQTAFLAHMPRNLWRTKGRMNFPLDSLVLYLPLWHPELSGSPIISKDLNAYSCAVTGAVHNPPLGRTLAGAEQIALPAAFNTLVASHEQGTIIFWVKPTALAGICGFFGQGGANIANPAAFHCEFRAAASVYYLSLLQHKDGGLEAFDLPRGNTAITINNWYCCAISSNGTNYFMEVNGVVQTLTFTLGSNTGDWFSDTVPAAPASYIGANQYGGAIIEYLTGVIGEGFIFYPMLPLLVRQHVHQVTKWRYS